MTRLAVQDVMSTEVISVEETATFKEVVTLLENHGAGALVVFRDGVPVGVVSEADLLLKQGFPAAGWRGG